MRKCIRLLTKLSPIDQEKFQRWLEAELNGREPIVLQLLKSQLQGETEEEFWQNTYPDTPVDSQEIGRKFGQLLVHLEEHLAVQAFRKDRLLRDRMLVRKLNELRLGEDFLKYANKIRRRLTQGGRKDKEYFACLYALEGEISQHYLVERVSPKRRRVLQIKESFFQWWGQAFLHQRIIQKIAGAKSLPGLPAGWEDRLAIMIHELEREQASPVLSLYVKIDEVLDGKESDINEILKQLRKHQFAMPWDIRYNLFAILFNYVSRKTARDQKGSILLPKIAAGNCGN